MKMGIDITAFGLPIEVIVEGKRMGKGEETTRKEMVYRVFPDVNKKR